MKAGRTYHSSADGKRYIDAMSSFCDDISTYYSLGSLMQDSAEPQNSERDTLGRFAQKIMLSPVGGALLKEARNDGWSFGLAELENGDDFHIDVPAKTVILNDDGLTADSISASDYFQNMILINMIRALRDIWQERRHGAFSDMYGPENVLMLERIRNADCDSISILVAWQIRSEGENSLWRHIIGSDEGDMALAFSRYLDRDPSGLFNGKALAAAFKQWYRCEERVNHCDHATLEYLDQIVKSDAHYNTFGNKKLTPVGVEVLSCMPDKTAYLQGSGEEILRNPDYAGLLDPINQSHFFHIVHDMQVVRVNDVPFRDANLARLIFPEGENREER